MKNIIISAVRMRIRTRSFFKKCCNFFPAIVGKTFFEISQPKTLFPRPRPDIDDIAKTHPSQAHRNRQWRFGVRDLISRTPAPPLRPFAFNSPEPMPCNASAFASQASRLQSTAGFIRQLWGFRSIKHHPTSIGHDWGPKPEASRSMNATFIHASLMPAESRLKVELRSQHQ